MKINHGDTGSALTFRWTYVSSTYSSQDGRNSGRSDSTGSSVRSHETFPRHRFHHAACCLGKYVYIFGGKDGYSPLRDMWRFDTVTQEWEQIDDVKGKIPHLQGHTMLPYKAQLLIFGGTFSDTVEDTPLWIYNTDLHHVYKFHNESCTACPVGRREHSAVVYKSIMYIYGGFLDSSGSTDEFWGFSIEENAWRMIRRHKPGKRHGHVTVVADGKMWLHGGMRGLMALSDLWIFHFGMNTWSKIRGVGVCPTLSNHTAHVVDKSIILFGGSKSGILSQDVWIFRIDTLTWRHVLTQQGDQCPPITLHTSVLLSAEPSPHTVKSRAHSLPYLKGKSVISSELKSGRPWTSPTVSSGNEGFTSESEASRVDILCLDTVRTTLDGNNNNNQGDIHGRAEGQITEAETSFFSEDHHDDSVRSPQEPASFEPSVRTIYSSCRGHSNNFGQAFTQHPELSKIIPASNENCKDVVPLLERFHSVSSDVDLGENNLTVTLSDEEIFQSRLSPGNLQLNNFSQCSCMCKHSRHHIGEPAAHLGFHNMFSKKAFVAHEELSVEGQIKELQNFGMCRDSEANDRANEVKQYVSPENDKTVGTTIKNSMSNCFSNYHIAELVDATSLGPLSRFDCSEKLLISNSSLPNDFPLPLAMNEKSQQDLIVEDLESNDISELFRNIKISSPPKSYFRSSSLKSLYSCINDLLDHPEAAALSKSQWTVSCGNLVSRPSNNCEVDNLKPQHRVRKNATTVLPEFQPNTQTLLLEKQPWSGKYIKNVTPCARSCAPYLLRFQDGLYKFPNIAKISVGTQTTGSQTSLPGPKSSLTTADQSSQVDQNVTHIRAGDTVQEQVKPVSTANNSMFIGGKLCVLVIGGQTESHSFQAEPLKIWRCCLH